VPRQVAKIIQLAALAASALSADILKLRNRQLRIGTYLGGDAPCYMVHGVRLVSSFLNLKSRNFAREFGVYKSDAPRVN